MLMWEWNPVFRPNAKPASFEVEGQTWIWARGCRSEMLWLSILFGVWGIGALLASNDIAERIQIGICAGLFCLSWYLSRRYTETAWRITDENRLSIMMRTGQILDLGPLTSVRAVLSEDFELFRSRTFFTLRFPMLKFKHKRSESFTGVIGNLPCIMTFGLNIPVYIGVAYASFGWGAISLESGSDLTLLASGSPNQSWLLTAYTSEAAQLGLKMFSPSSTSKSQMGSHV